MLAYIHISLQENVKTINPKALTFIVEPLVHECPPLITEHSEKRYKSQFIVENPKKEADHYV